MPMTPRTRLLAVGLAAAAAGAVIGAPPAQAASPDVLITQVYGGGGNSGATYTNDFVELANRGATAVDLTGWSVQYASAAGTSWQVTPLSGSIQPGGHYLIQEAAGNGGTTPLPTPDATGTISLAAGSGKVALVTVATALTCGAACHDAAGVRDFVGYGTANDFETAAAPALSNTTAAIRRDGDTDNNSADFAAAAPDPHNGGAPPPAPARVHDIQGAAHRSPKEGQAVTGVTGVVTAVGTNGFWIQDPQPDDNPATSEGIFVFTSKPPTVAAADAVTVAGKVSEVRPGNTATNLTTTEITAPTVTVTGHGAALPASTVVGPGGRVAPTPVRTDAPGDV